MNSKDRVSNQNEVMDPPISGREVTLNSYPSVGYHTAHTGTKACTPPHLPAVKRCEKKTDTLSGWETTINLFPEAQ